MDTHSYRNQANLFSCYAFPWDSSHSHPLQLYSFLFILLGCQRGLCYFELTKGITLSYISDHGRRIYNTFTFLTINKLFKSWRILKFQESKVVKPIGENLYFFLCSVHSLILVMKLGMHNCNKLTQDSI